MKNFIIAMLTSGVSIIIIDKLFGGYIAEGLHEKFIRDVKKTYDSLTNFFTKIIQLIRRTAIRTIHPTHTNVDE